MEHNEQNATQRHGNTHTQTGRKHKHKLCRDRLHEINCQLFQAAGPELDSTDETWRVGLRTDNNVIGCCVPTPVLADFCPRPVQVSDDTLN